MTATPREKGYRQRLFDGRIEKRLPVAISVYVTSAKEPHDVEKTLTQNISPHGARLVTQRLWKPGEEPLITPLTGEFPQPAKVVYCQPSANFGFYLGLEFPGRSVKWGGWPSG